MRSRTGRVIGGPDRQAHAWRRVAGTAFWSLTTRRACAACWGPCCGRKDSPSGWRPAAGRRGTSTCPAARPSTLPCRSGPCRARTGPRRPPPCARRTRRAPAASLAGTRAGTPRARRATWGRGGGPGGQLLGGGVVAGAGSVHQPGARRPPGHVVQLLGPGVYFLAPHGGGEKGARRPGRPVTRGGLRLDPYTIPGAPHG